MLRGDRLKSLRESSGYTHQKLAELLDITTPQIWRYESGKTDPTGDVLSRMARVFNVSADYLLGLSADQEPFEATYDALSAKEQAIITAVRRGEKVEAIKVIISEN